MSQVLRDNGEYVRKNKPYPVGPKLQMSKRWKDDVRRALNAKGWDHRRLEAELGVGRGMVTRMLSEAQGTSALVTRVSDLLGIAPAVSEVTDAAEIEMLVAWRSLPLEERALHLALMKAKQKKS